MGALGRWLAGLLGVALLLLGGAAAWAAVAQGSGWITSGSEEFRTDSRALVTDEIDVTSGRTGDPPMDLGELANVRVRTGATDGDGKPLFVGIARRADVDRYLTGVSYDRLERLERNPFRAEIRRVQGEKAPQRPSGQKFWVATGSDDRNLTWDKSSGTWTLVVMNDDASPGVEVRADAGLRFGFLPWAAGGLLFVALLLLVLALKPRRRRTRAHARR